MPTGYTAKLMESGQSFPEFVLTCARAFGALIMMRDADPGAPIPEKFEPSDFYSKKLENERAMLAKLVAMTVEEQIAFGTEEKGRALLQYGEWRLRELAENDRIQEMVAQVSAWVPPTAEHAELKAFMLQQLDISKHNPAYLDDQLAKWRDKPDREFFDDALREVADSIPRYEMEQQKEIERTAARNRWVQELRASLAKTTTQERR